MVPVALGVGGVGDEFQRSSQIGAALGNDPQVQIPHLAVPHDLEGLAFLDDGIEQTPVVGGGHGHLAVGQQLRGLGARFPPHHAGLDGVQLLEGPVDAGRRAEHLVDLVDGHAVGDQGELELGFRVLAHTALARELLHVEEIGERGWLGTREFALVVGVDRGPHDLADGTLGQGARDEVILGRGAIGRRRQDGMVDLLEQPLVAATHGVGELDVHQVPGDIAGLDLGLHLGEATVVVLREDLDAGLLLPRLVVGLDLAVGIGTAPGHHGQGLGCQHGRSGDHPDGGPGHGQIECFAEALHSDMSPLNFSFFCPHRRRYCRSDRRFADALFRVLIILDFLVSFSDRALTGSPARGNLLPAILP